MNILITGGTGFIGSHTVVVLQKAGHNVIVVDNFYNSSPLMLDRIRKITNKEITFYECDAASETQMEDIFISHSIDGIIHFAGFKAVGESVEKPLMYYYNNVVSTMILAKLCLKHGVNKFVFSSSATVYGENEVPFKETMTLLPATNPYGQSKVMSEQILMDIAKANPNFSVALLRYFNPIGAHESGLIGEMPSGIPNNLMPYITKVAKGELKQLNIFGNDYSTEDGTGVRDYIHVMDLAQGHMAAFDNLTEGVHIYNLGTGKGTSVLQLIKGFEEATGVKIAYKFAARRAGDIAQCYADASKANKELGWTAQKDILDMCRDAWRFEFNYKK
jgi:UDP-glucose 4-epimerase